MRISICHPPVVELHVSKKDLPELRPSHLDMVRCNFGANMKSLSPFIDSLKTKLSTHPKLMLGTTIKMQIITF